MGTLYSPYIYPSKAMPLSSTKQCYPIENPTSTNKLVGFTVSYISVILYMRQYRNAVTAALPCPERSGLLMLQWQL